MTSPHQQLQVTMVGKQALETALDGASADSGVTLSVSRTPPADVDNELAATDCLLVDQQPTADSWQTIVDRVAESHPTLAVVLVGEGFESTVSAAIEAGVADSLPRSLCASEPERVATRLASLADSSPVTDTLPHNRDATAGELFENVSDGLVLHEPDTGIIVDVNERFCDMTGYSRDVLVDEHIDLVTAEGHSYEAATDRIQQAATEGTQLFEWYNQRRNGDRFPVEVHLSVVQIDGREYVLASVRDITERKRREQEFEQIFNGVTDGIAVLDPDTLEIREANQAYLEMAGYDSLETIQQEGVEGLSATQAGYTVEESREINQRVAETGEPEIVDWQLETKDGDQRALEIKVTPAVIGGEQVNIASHRDITERKQREREYEQIFDGVNDTISVHDPDTGELLAVNETLSAVTGYDRETLLEMGVDGLTIDTEDFPIERIQDVIDRVMDGEDVAPYEQAIRTATGDQRWLEVNPTRAVIDGEERFLGIARDVTTRRERQQRLATERDRRSALFENNPHPVLRLEFVDGEPVIREVNAAFEQIFGFEATTVVGSTVGDALVPESERERYEQFRDTVAQGETIEREAPRQTAAGLRQFVFRVIQFDMGDGESTSDAYVWYTDVTERRRREEAIRTLQDATARMQRAETQTEIADIAVDVAKEALDLPVARCWFHDEDAAQLDPVTATVRGQQQIPSTPLSTECDEYDVFQTGEVTPYTPRDRLATTMEKALLLPLGDHGLIVAGREDQFVDDDVILDVARTLAEQTTTALSRIERAQEVRRSKRRLQAVIDRIDEAIFLAPISELNEGRPAPDFVSSGYEELWGQPLDAVHETYEDGFFGTLHPDDCDSYRAFLNRIISDVEDGVPDERYTREYRIERPDGEIRWIHSAYYPTTWGNAEPRIVIASRDITQRKERARTLESFHDATAELTTADTVTDASQIAVEAATDIFGLPATAVYHYDEETGRLAPTATGTDVPPPTQLPPLTADQSDAWEAFVDNQFHRVTVDAESPLTIGPSEAALLFPLGGNGIIVVWRSGESFDTEAASILAATLEAALNRLRGERQLESRRAELEAQTERAQRLDAIAELTQRVDAAITANSSRQGIQEAVCAELVDVDPFVGGWIAAAEVGTDRLTPRTVAGIDRDHAEHVLGSPDGTDRHPATDAWQTGETQVVNDLVGSGRRSDWRQLLLKMGAGSICAVPLTYDGVTYGVLTIIADEPDAFGDRELDVFSQLSTSIGYAITATQRQRALESDNTLELEFEGVDMDLPIANLAHSGDCRVRHERTVRRQDGSVSVYYRLLGELPTDLENLADSMLPGDVTIISQQDGEAVLERQGSSWFGAVVSEYGGVLRRCRATTDGVTLVIELPQETDTRTIVNRLQDTFPPLELTAQRQHRETDVTSGAVQSQLEHRLSDRQYEAIKTGHAMGYFEWPRESSGEDVADRLDITQPTVNKHIRLAEQKVFDLLFESS